MRAGVDPVTGKWLKGWPHCVACLNYLFNTRIGTVRWRRLYGTPMRELQDHNATNDTLLEFYEGMADAIDSYEPGFVLQTVQLLKSGRDGRFVFDIVGIFYPKGHLGDYTVTENQSYQFSRSSLLPGGIELV